VIDERKNPVHTGLKSVHVVAECVGYEQYKMFSFLLQLANIDAAFY
jgi:hypothetical protein